MPKLSEATLRQLIAEGETATLELANDRGLVNWERQPALKATMEDIDMEQVN